MILASVNTAPCLKTNRNLFDAVTVTDRRPNSVLLAIVLSIRNVHISCHNYLGKYV